MKAKYALEAVVYEYDESKGQAAEEYKRIRDVPQDRVVATLEGTWKGAITWKRKGDKVCSTGTPCCARSSRLYRTRAC
jgi:hypothetical protein